MYTQADANQLQLLFRKVVNNNETWNEVEMFYKKYINPNAQPSNNSSCCSKIIDRFNELRDFYVQNDHKFIN